MSNLTGWSEDAQLAMQNGNGYFTWWDRVKTGVLFAGIVAVVWAWNRDKKSRELL